MYLVLYTWKLEYMSFKIVPAVKNGYQHFY